MVPCCCCCYWRADGRRLYRTKLFCEREGLMVFPNYCCPERWFGLNRISYPDWVKLWVELNYTPNKNSFCYTLHSPDLKKWIGWLFGFYDISIFVDYLMPNPFLWSQEMESHHLMQYSIISRTALYGVGWLVIFLWHINPCELSNTKSCFHIHMIFKWIVCR